MKSLEGVESQCTVDLINHGFRQFAAGIGVGAVYLRRERIHSPPPDWGCMRMLILEYALLTEEHNDVIYINGDDSLETSEGQMASGPSIQCATHKLLDARGIGRW